ncbi:hypothetical protein [Devosia sp. A16]|uniref:hypothetical protein n=1 Tax=Devosia sp. A16 TaxID=1736675 RepID=UPI0006D7FC06|nr:hypothetical protein [Devosia sp. A16]
MSLDDTRSVSLESFDLGPADAVDGAVRVILHLLETDPTIAPDLLAGYEIVPKRGARGAHLHKARERRSELNQIRLQRVDEVIERERQLNPTIGIRELAAALNAAGLTTYRGYPFGYIRTEDHLRRARKAAANQDAGS